MPSASVYLVRMYPAAQWLQGLMRLLLSDLSGRSSAQLAEAAEGGGIRRASVASVASLCVASCVVVVYGGHETDLAEFGVKMRYRSLWGT